MRLGWGSEAARSECARLGCSGFSGLGRWVGAGNLVAVGCYRQPLRPVHPISCDCLLGGSSH